MPSTLRVVSATLSIALVLFLSAPAAAQSGAAFFSKTALSGYVDTYYAYNRNRPETPCEVVNGVAVFNCLHAFDVARNSFSLNLVELALEKMPTEDSRGGFRVDLAYGPGATLIADADSGRQANSPNVLQAYVSYSVAGGDRLQIDFGKFVTPAGFERIDPGQNWNGSRSLLFALAIPRAQVGLRAVYAPSDTLTITGLLTDGWSDLTRNTGARRVGISVALRPVPVLTLTGTYLGGPEASNEADGWRDLLDTSIAARITKRISLAANADFGNDRRTLQSWQGVGVYMRYQIRDWFAITPRVEALHDPDAFMTGTQQDLQEATATAEFRPSRDAVLRLEYRVDVTDERYLLQGVSNTVRTQSILSANWVFLFSSRGSSSPEQNGPLSRLRQQ